jgi:hypothetical protein
METGEGLGYWACHTEEARPKSRAVRADAPKTEARGLTPAWGLAPYHAHNSSRKHMLRLHIFTKVRRACAALFGLCAEV